MRPRLLYMGFGRIGCACLTELIANDFDVVGVFCRATDRAERADPTSVFGLAQKTGLHCFSAENPSDSSFLSEAKELAPDLLLSVQYDRILRPPLLAIPRYGAYNLHFGPLPRLRGCFPTKWAIIENEPAGVAFHCIDPGIDSGDVVDRELVPLAVDETDESLYHRLQDVGFDVFRRQLPWMKRLEPPARLPQDSAEASYHPKALPFGGIVDWHREAGWLERFVRAYTFPPYPFAKTWLDGNEVQIPAPVAIGPSTDGAEPGQLSITGGRDIAVACGTGSLILGRVHIGGEIEAANAALHKAAAAGRVLTTSA